MSISMVPQAPAKRRDFLSGIISHLPAPMQAQFKDVTGPNPHAEPEPLHGAVYRVDPGGRFTVLQEGNATRTTLLPADVVRDNRVVIAAEGVWIPLKAYQRDFHQVLQAPQKFADIGQPFIGVHEGNDGTKQGDVIRLVKNLAYMKALQWSSKATFNIPAMYRNDPSVKALHDHIKAALDGKHEVLLVPHSGGGPETALALTILAREGRRDDIAQHVRVLSLSAAVSHQSYTRAGVPAENIYYTADDRDPVGKLARAFTIDFSRPWSSLKAAINNGVQGVQNLGKDWHHALPDVFKAGHPDAIQAFIDGGPGGIFYRSP